MAALTQEELDAIKILQDPVLWAKITFNWDARWYQQNIVRDTHKRIVIRAGRRIGKCLPGWVTVFDPTTGDNVSVEELYRRGTANITTMTDQLKIDTTSTPTIFDNGTKEVFRVTLSSGRTIDATGNHPLYTVDGWKEIDELKVGDHVATPKALPYFGKESMTPEEIKVLAYIIGDGNCKGTNLRFSTVCPVVLQEMQEICKSFDVGMKQYESNSLCDYHLRNIKGTGPGTNKIRNLLRLHGVWDKGSGNKRVPEKIFRLPKEDIALFLSRLFATDGWACASEIASRNKKLPQVGYCSISEGLARDVQHLLLRFGIQSHLKLKQVKYNGGHNPAWQLTITSSRGILQFANEIGIYSKEEGVNAAVDACNLRKAKEATIPEKVMQLVESERVKQGLRPGEMLWLGANPIVDRYRTYYAPQRFKVLQWSKTLKNERLYDLATSDINWDKITSIESIGMHQTYDLTVPGTHNFIANDIIVHNTDSLCVKALYNAFTKPNRTEDETFVVLIVTPYESQIQLIFNRIRELIGKSEELQASVKRDVLNPQEIEFWNKAVIRGFTAGSRSGSGASNIRGQRGDLIILDETDYLNSADINTIMAIPLEDPDRIQVIASSTPCGKREHFYRWCTKPKIGWNQYHYPSSVNPTWNKNTEEEFRETLSELAYIQEIDAEFGEELAGVYQKKYLDLAVQAGIELNIQYLTGDPGRRGPRILGVDWDKMGASTNMIAMEWIPEYAKFVPIHRIEIPRTEFTFDNAVKKIIEMEAIWGYDYIYVDRGAGEYQVETLRKYGMAHPETGMHKKVIGVNFSEKILVRDPHTKQKEKKHIKPWMVNNSVINFERLEIALNPNDKQLIRQLENYRVKSVSQDGRPVYSDEDDHILDAMNLALYGMISKFSDIIKVRLATKIVGLSNNLDSVDQVADRNNTSLHNKKPVLKKGTTTFVLSAKTNKNSRGPRNSLPKRKSF